MNQLPDYEKIVGGHAKASDKVWSYHALVKRGKKWECHAWFWASGYSCTAAAKDHFSLYGVEPDKYRIVMNDEWVRIQTRQHLRDVGIKQKR